MKRVLDNFSSEEHHDTASSSSVVCCVCIEPSLLAANKKVVVLGIDGMDPKLLQTFVDQGRMPNFKALMAEGDFRPLQTTMPPQSPVAWSTFMTGMDPGGHGIFDFIHVDRAKMAPYSSMAQADPGWPSDQHRLMVVSDFRRRRANAAQGHDFLADARRARACGPRSFACR